MKLIYGIPKGETERYHEELLATQAQTLAQIQAVKDAATKDGWHSFRVVEFRDATSGADLANMFRKTVKG